MKPKTARRFLNRNEWKIARKIGNSSFWRRVNQAKVTLGADPLKLLERDSFADRLARMFRF